MFLRPAKILFSLSAALLLGILLVGCGSTECPEPEPCPEVDCPETECPETECPTLECPETVAVPFEDLWMESGHADAEAEAFRHWDEDGEVQAACANCHSSTGFIDFIGGDGSQAGVVDNPVATDTVITCETCHNEAALSLSSVTFPSGSVISDLGREAVCMTCHQGRASGNTLTTAFAELGDEIDEDMTYEGLRFTNIHYYAAAVSRYGTLVGGGYEYAGKAYDALFDHVSGVQDCQDCHDPHSLEIKTDTCVSCHEGVTTAEAARDIRMLSSMVDYDGDGDISEGIYYELTGLQDLLYKAMQTYGQEVTGSGLLYDAATYPYFFNDTNGDGVGDADELVNDNSFATWTPRLLKAAYNYQTSLKDPGAYAHGGKYIIQLLYDSIDDLNQALSSPVDLSAAKRIDHGHFAGSEEAFRHWDEEGMVEADCAKCHSGYGLPQLVEEGVNSAQPITNGLMCETCHSDLTTYERYVMEEVEFPSGATLAFADNTDANLCLNCHQGRNSTVGVSAAVAGLEADTPSESLSFSANNSHYFSAGATLFGTEAKGIYEYAGKEYLGAFTHVTGFNTCIDCHDAHELELATDSCAGCHGVEDPALIRGASSTIDYDGDGDMEEGIAGEIETMHEKLYTAMQAYASEILEVPIIYSEATYPYYFIDIDANGQVDPGEAIYPNQYVNWSPRLLQAAYNYQYVVKDPGAYAHNGKYVLQVLYDTLMDLGTKVSVDMTGMTRP